MSPLGDGRRLLTFDGRLWVADRLGIPVPMADWRYLVVRRLPGGAGWVPMAVGLEMDFPPGIPVEHMLHRCGAYGWELVAVSHDGHGEVFYFKKPT